MTKNMTQTMDQLLADNDFKGLSAADVVDGTIISIKKHEIWLDIGVYGIGVVMRREMGITEELNVGDSLTVGVVDPEFEDGYALLSLRKAAKDRGWDELQRICDAGERNSRHHCGLSY
jgi:small subunit ribosomal protein S1